MEVVGLRKVEIGGGIQHVAGSSNAPALVHNRFRKLLIRFEKGMENYRGLVHFACALIVYD